MPTVWETCCSRLYIVTQSWRHNYYSSNGRQMTSGSVLLLLKLIVTQLVKKFCSVMVPRRSVLFQEPSTAPILRQVNPVHTHSPYFSKTQFNITLSVITRSSRLLHLIRFSNQNFVWMFPLACVLYMPFVSSWYEGSESVQQRLQVMKFVVMQCYLSACHLSLNPNVVSVTLFSNTLGLYSFNMKHEVSHACSVTDKVALLFILISVFLGSRRDN
jgi:hypothetical protein